jgi:DNA repair exonuclease SbcCD ATPase subunit
MTDLRKAAEMALGALETHVPHAYKDRGFEPIQALRQALANEFNPDWNQVEALQESLREHMAEIQRLRQALEQPKQRGHCTCGMAEQARMEEREACLKKIAIELNKWKQGIVTQKMIQDRVQKEIDELRQALEESANSTTDFVEPKTPVQQEQEHLFRIERRGSEWSIYRGRDHQHQGFLLGWLVETDYKTAKMLEDRLNAAPPKREWVGLTGDDKHFLLANAWNKEQAFDSFMDAIDKFLKEKNT